jgi:hypothetical protein
LQDDEGKDLVLVEADGKITVDLVIQMFTVHAEAVGRCRELSSPAEATRNMRQLFRTLLEHLNHRYVDVALDMYPLQYVIMAVVLEKRCRLLKTRDWSQNSRNSR